MNSLKSIEKMVKNLFTFHSSEVGVTSHRLNCADLGKKKLGEKKNQQIIIISFQKKKFMGEKKMMIW